MGQFIVGLNQISVTASRSTWRSMRLASFSSAFFYTAVVFNPEETADNLSAMAGFIPGIRPGKNTANYLDYVLTRITVLGAAYITAVCVVPEAIMAQTGMGSLFFGWHQLAHRGQRDGRHHYPDPVASAGAPVWRFDQEGQA